MSDVKPLEFQLREHEFLNIGHNEFKGKVSVGVRIFSTWPDLDEARPTKKGVNILYGDQLEKVIEKLQELQAAHGEDHGKI